MKKIICSCFIVVFLCACKEPKRYSIIPEIKFLGFERINQTDGLLHFYFQDGDGDFGLNGDDTYPPFDPSSVFYYNFFCAYYEKQNDVFVFIDSIEARPGVIEPFLLNARIPRVSPLPEESVHGEIFIEMQPYRDISEYDTVKLEFYIVDRKLHKSNVVGVEIVR
jgi:hypothetical protein